MREYLGATCSVQYPKFILANANGVNPPQRSSREGKRDIYSTQLRPPLDQLLCMKKDGYTVEKLDVWGVVDGFEKIVVPNVG